MANEVGAAYVSIMPSMDNFQKALRATLKGFKFEVPDGFTEPFEEETEESGKKAGTNAASGFVDSVQSTLNKSANSIISNARSIGQKLSNGFTSAYSKVGSVMTSVAKAQIQASAQMSKYVVNGIKNAYSSVASVMKSIGIRAGQYVVEGIKASYNSVINTMRDIGARAGQYLADGIRKAYSSVGSIIASVANSQVTTASNMLGISIGKGVMNGISTMRIAVGSAVGGLISSAVGTATGSISSAISRLDTIKQYPKIMEGMGIVAEESEASIQSLSEAIDGLPTALNDIVSFTQKIVPAMNNDIYAATDAAIAFNDALVAGGKDVMLQANAMEQWSQMLAANKVDMAAWRSVVNAMPAQMYQLAKSLGYVNTQELYTALSKDKLSLQELNDALIKLDSEGFESFASFAEQARNSTATIGTAIANFSNRIAKAEATILEWIGRENIAGLINSISSKFGPFAKSVTDFLDSINTKRYVVEIVNTFGDALRSLVDQAQPLRASLAPILSSGLSTMLGIIANTLATIVSRSKPLFTAAASFVDSVAALSNYLQPILDAIVTAKFDSLISAMQMWQKILYAITPYLESIIYAQMQVNSAVSALVGNLAGRLAPIVADIFGTVADMVASAVPFVTKFVDAFAPVFVDVYKQIERIFYRVLALVDSNNLLYRGANALDRVLVTVGNTVARILDIVVPRLPAAFDNVANIAERMGPIVVSLADPVARLVETVLRMVEKATPFLGRLVPAMIPVFNTLVGQVERVFDIIVSTLDDAPLLKSMSESMSEVFHTVGVTVGDLVESLLPRLAGVMSTVSSIVQSIAPVSEKIANVAADTLQTVLGMISASTPFVNRFVDAFAPAFETVRDQIASIYESVLAIVDNNDFIASMSEPITRIIDDVGGVAGGAVGLALPQLPGILSETVTLLERIGSAIASAILPVLPQITGATSTVNDTIASLTERLAGPVAQAFASIYSTVANLFADNETTIGDVGIKLSEILPKVAEQIADIFNAIAPYLPQVIDAFGSIVDTAGPAIVNIINTLAPHLPKIADTIASIANSLAPAVSDMVAKAEPFIDPALDLFEKAGAFAGDHLEGILLLVGGIKAASAAISGLSGFGKIIEGLTTIKGLIGGEGGLLSMITGSGAGEAISGAVAAVGGVGPALGIVGGIAAIAGSLIYCWNTSEQFREGITGTLASIQDAFGRLWEEVKPILEKIWEFLGKYIKPILETIAQVVGGLFLIAFKLAGEIIVGVLDTITFLLDGIKSALDWLYHNLLEPVIGAFKTLFDWINKIEPPEWWGDFSGQFTNNTSVPSTRPFATGGIVTGPTRALIGEAGVPEAVVPLSAQGVQKFTSGLAPQYAPGAPSVEVHIDTFMNYDTDRDVRSLSEAIGKDTLRQLKMQGVYA